jgi:hypothetical protein
VIFLCLSPEDRKRWDELNRQTKALSATLPCADCPREYAAEMFAKYRCNGFPGMTTIPKSGRQGPDMTVLRARVAYLEEGAVALAARMASLEEAITVAPADHRRAQWREYKARVRAQATCPCVNTTTSVSAGGQT